MWSKDIHNESEVWFRDVTGLNLKREHIPVIIAIFTTIVLILFVIVVYILWRCCVSTKATKNQEAVSVATIEKNVSHNSNYSTFCVESKSFPLYSSSQIVEMVPEHEDSLHWLYRSNKMQERSPVTKEKQSFNPVTYTPEDSEDVTDACNLSRIPKPYSSSSVILAPVLSLDDYSLPQISEFSTQNCFHDYMPENNFHIFRTRSLPSCVRLKRHPSTVVDSTAELYDKVNFSKKRKNRMRNDEAAIIASSKYHSQFFNKDTDALVDSEAVIVYDERTAL